MDKQQAIQDINHARAWAWKYFNANGASDTRLVDDDLNIIPPAFVVDFPKHNTMRVRPSIMGKPFGWWFEYELARIDGKLFWKCTNRLPLPFRQWPDLEVIE